MTRLNIKWEKHAERRKEGFEGEKTEILFVSPERKGIEERKEREENEEKSESFLWFWFLVLLSVLIVALVRFFWLLKVKQLTLGSTTNHLPSSSRAYYFIPKAFLETTASCSSGQRSRQRWRELLVSQLNERMRDSSWTRRMLSWILIWFMQDAKCHNLFHFLLSFFNCSDDNEKVVMVVMLASGQHLENKGRRDVVSVLFCLVFCVP